LLLIVLVSLDMQNVASRWCRFLTLENEDDDDYTFIVPILGDTRYFRNEQ